MNTKENQDLANELGKQILALQKIKEALEKSDIAPDAPSKEAASFTPVIITPQQNEEED